MSNLQNTTISEIYLLPGELYFCDKLARIHTVLGSCVSIVLWHPILHCGGMCHFVLPSRGMPDDCRLDGRYADEAIKLILHEMAEHHTRPEDYRVKLFGGGNMFQHLLAKNTFNVARDNIEAARVLLEANGFSIQAEHVGGNGHRRIIFDLYDGKVWVRHEKIPDSRMTPVNSVAVKPMAII